ncbi:aliphatic glucosinolate S-oxygenase [Sarracenia purpurea var. burkii]
MPKGQTADDEAKLGGTWVYDPRLESDPPDIHPNRETARSIPYNSHGGSARGGAEPPLGRLQERDRPTYKSAIGPLRNTWKIASSIEWKEEGRKNKIESALVRNYRSKIGSELSSYAPEF